MRPGGHHTSVAAERAAFERQGMTESSRRRGQLLNRIILHAKVGGFVWASWTGSLRGAHTQMPTLANDAVGKPHTLERLKRELFA